MDADDSLNLEMWALSFPDAAAALFGAFAGGAVWIPRECSRERIADRLADARARRGFSQAAFADALGLSLERLRLYEHGWCPMDSQVLTQAAQLGVDLRYVLLGKPSPG